jgi:hypothetical protein
LAFSKTLAHPIGALKLFGRNEMDPPLCGSTSMSHNEFTIREPIEPQEAVVYPNPADNSMSPKNR